MKFTGAISASKQGLALREIAELTGKNHADVMRDIRNMMEALEQDSKLNPVCKTTTYVGANGQSYEQYELDKDTCLTLLLGYDAVARMRVVKRWQELESMVDQPRVPQTMPEALRLAAEAIEQRDRLALENKAKDEALAEAAPKVEALNRILAARHTLTMTEVAKVLQIKMDELTGRMHSKRWIYRINGSWVGYDYHIKNGDLAYKEARYTDENTGLQAIKPYCHVTQQGLVKLALMFGVNLVKRAA